jgi:hypothetical protein
MALRSWILLLALVGCDGADAPATDADGDGVEVGVDCDDMDARIGAPFLAYTDADGDQFGVEPVTVCALTEGLAPLAGDCDDSDAVTHPFSQESCDAAGADEDCDGLVDDEDPSTDASTTTEMWIDADLDGYGNGAPVFHCHLSPGFSDVMGDCDDSAATSYPLAAELCDGVDNDCDSQADEDDAVDPVELFNDGDGDGFGDPATGMTGCPMNQWVLDRTDCDDTRPEAYPGADEVCNELDDDCDGDSDEDAVDATAWYVDADSDHFGDASTLLVTCLGEPGYVPDANDCDDTDPAIAPGGQEVCDDSGTDEDCNGLADDDDPGVFGAPAWFVDADGDGYGAGSIGSTCEAPTGGVGLSGDCDDVDAAVSPDAFEVCGDDVDNDCDGITACDLVVADADRTFTGVPAGSGFSGDLATSDIDGDGVYDLIFGTGGAGASAAYVVTGGSSGDLDMGSATTTFTCASPACTGAGAYVAGIGDTDGDGSGALAIGGSGDDGAGIVYVFDGPAAGVQTLDTADATWTGEDAGDDASELRVAGDVDGDGTLDLLIGAPARGSGAGAVYLITTYDTGAADLSALATATFSGEAAGDALGISGGRGDLDGDGADDVIVGAPGQDAGGSDAGALSVFFGPLSGDYVASDADVVLLGAAGELVGLSAIGDLDDDGYVELLAGSDNGGADNTVYVIAGPADATSALTTAIATIDWTGAALSALSAGGDLDADGRADLLLGYADGDSAGTDSGVAALFLGSLSGALGASDADWTLDGDAAEDRVGRVVRFVPSQDGTTGSDILIGAPGASSDGAAYLFYGDSL